MTIAADAWALALGDMPLSEGFRLREEARVRFFPARDAARFQKLVSIGDLDAFLASAAAKAPRVSLADSSRQGSAGIPEDEFTRDDEDGSIDLPRLLALYDAGATLVLSQMDEVLPPLGRLCRGLERVFLHPVQCNLYLTPPRAQGFRIHYDTHDVLILQVQGEKLWRYWPTPAIAFANNRTPWENHRPQPQGEPRNQMIRPGDVLYVPRGIMHDAASQGTQSSLHLTIGLLDVSWADALRAALDVMDVQDASLRQSFPTWRLAEGGISEAMVQEAGQRLAALGGTGAMEMMSQQLLLQLARGQTPMLSRGLNKPTVSLADRLYLSDTVHHFVVPLPDGGAELRWAGGRLAVTAQELAWITRLDEGTSANELAHPDALAFCQKLAELGLVIVQPIAAMKAAE